MKNASWAIFALTFFALSLCVCGYDGDGNGGDCSDWCQKRVECCQSDPDCQFPLTVDDCMTDCEKANEIFTDEVLDGMDVCMDNTCDEMKVCLEQLVATCPGDASGTVTGICTKMVECNPDITLEQCQAGFWTNVPVKLECFRQSALDGLVSCVQNADCATFNEDWDLCAEEHLGIRKVGG